MLSRTAIRLTKRTPCFNAAHDQRTRTQIPVGMHPSTRTFRHSLGTLGSLRKPGFACLATTALLSSPLFNERSYRSKMKQGARVRLIACIQPVTRTAMSLALSPSPAGCSQEIQRDIFGWAPLHEHEHLTSAWLTQSPEVPANARTRLGMRKEKDKKQQRRDLGRTKWRSSGRARPE